MCLELAECQQPPCTHTSLHSCTQRHMSCTHSAVNSYFREALSAGPPPTPQQPGCSSPATSGSTPTSNPNRQPAAGSLHRQVLARQPGLHGAGATAGAPQLLAEATTTASLHAPTGSSSQPGPSLQAPRGNGISGVGGQSLSGARTTQLQGGAQPHGLAAGSMPPPQLPPLMLEDFRPKPSASSRYCLVHSTQVAGTRSRACSTNPSTGSASDALCAGAGRLTGSDAGTGFEPCAPSGCRSGNSPDLASGAGMRPTGDMAGAAGLEAGSTSNCSTSGSSTDSPSGATDNSSATGGGGSAGGGVGLGSLPQALLEEILSWCSSARDLAACSCACQALRKAATSELLWHALFVRRWGTVVFPVDKPASSSSMPHAATTHHTTTPSASPAGAAGNPASVAALTATAAAGSSLLPEEGTSPGAAASRPAAGLPSTSHPSLPPTLSFSTVMRAGARMNSTAGAAHGHVGGAGSMGPPPLPLRRVEPATSAPACEPSTCTSGDTFPGARAPQPNAEQAAVVAGSSQQQSMGVATPQADQVIDQHKDATPAVGQGPVGVPPPANGSTSWRQCYREQVRGVCVHVCTCMLRACSESMCAQGLVQHAVVQINGAWYTA